MSMILYRHEHVTEQNMNKVHGFVLPLHGTLDYVDGFVLMMSQEAYPSWFLILRIFFSVLIVMSMSRIMDNHVLYPLSLLQNEFV